MSYKARVPLASVSPSGQNPRRDFGDVSALARSIAATGGQPVNPIVVADVGEDEGGEPVFRIVDGERRYRALVELGAGEADVLVCAGWGEAEEAVAMMATDDKKALSDEERARGFQGMLALGVGDETVSGASGVDVGTVRRIRSMRAELPEQTSMDAMIAACAFDDPGDRARVLSSSDPSWVASMIRRERADDEAFDRVRLALLDAPLPVEFAEGEAPSPYSTSRMREEGVAFAFDAGSPAAAGRLAKKLNLEHPGCTARVWRSGRSARVFRVLDGDEGPSPEEVAEGLRNQSRDAYDGFVRSVAEWVPGSDPGSGDVASLVRADRRDSTVARVLGVDPGSGDATLASLMDSDPSTYEMALFLGRLSSFGIRTYRGDFDQDAARWADDLWQAAVADGWDPSGCEAMAAELAAWRASGSGEEES